MAKSSMVAAAISQKFFSTIKIYYLRLGQEKSFSNKEADNYKTQ
jgi:hypothetical protein